MERRTSPKDLVTLTVLGMLSEQPSHTYEIQRQIRSRHKDFAATKTRALYHAIEDLVRKGLAEPVETTRDGRRPERTVYQITEQGTEELMAWLTELLERPVAEYPVFNVAIGFLPYLPQDRALGSLVARTVALRAEIAMHQEVLRALQEDSRLPRLVVLELEHAIALRQAELKWVAGIVEDIRSGRLHWDIDWLIEQFAEHNAVERAQAAQDLEEATRRSRTRADAEPDSVRPEGGPSTIETRSDE
jgi:DNA-binding PadR family transcriptional regulator